MLKLYPCRERVERINIFAAAGAAKSQILSTEFQISITNVPTGFIPPSLGFGFLEIGNWIFTPFILRIFFSDLENIPSPRGRR